MFKEKTYRRLAKGFKALIEASIEAQKADNVKKCCVSSNHCCSGVRHHLNSWCTISFRGPRRSGHTTMMLKVGQELFENPAFIFMNHDHSSLFSKEIVKGKTYSSHNINAMRGTTHDAVFVDCGFWIKEKQREEILSYASAILACKGSVVLAFLE